MKDKFNEYCAGVMGFSIKPSKKESNGESSLFCTREAKDDSDFERFASKIGFHYRPYDDLNQMTEVVETLISKYNCSPFKNFTPEAKVACKVYRLSNKALKSIRVGTPIKQAFRNFILSTMPEES